MSGRPRNTLEGLVAAGAFDAELQRHRRLLLTDPLLVDPFLRDVQAMLCRWATAGSRYVATDIARRFGDRVNGRSCWTCGGVLEAPARPRVCDRCAERLDVKLCTACRRVLPRGAFPPNVKLQGGLDSQCRQCHADGTRRWRDGRREEINGARRVRHEPRRCGECSAEFVPKKVTSTLCSDRCRRVVKNRRDLERRPHGGKGPVRAG